MIIKVCGMRDPENIRAVEQAGADWMGFIFYPKSPRYVEVCPNYLPEQCKRVGVFVNEPLEHIIRKAGEYRLNYVQLHGQEGPGTCRKLQEAKLKVIKAFSVAEELGTMSLDRYEGCCDYFLFDTACPTHGGSGKAFDWNLVYSYRRETPFLLSGGINPQSLEALSQFEHPRWAGIDLNSGFETAPAVKDAALLHTFIKQVKQKIK